MKVMPVVALIEGAGPLLVLVPPPTTLLSWGTLSNNLFAQFLPLFRIRGELPQCSGLLVCKDTSLRGGIR